MKRLHQRPAKTSAHCEKHFRNRLVERYGLHTPASTVSEMIRSGQAEFLFKESLSRSHFAVHLEGQRVTVVYNRLLSTVVTAYADKRRIPAE